MFEHGEIVLIPVPFSNLASVKRRPVLVLSNNAYNKSSIDMIVVAITSNLSQKGIQISSDDLENGILPKTSVIKVDKIYTLEQSIAIKKISKLKNKILTEVFNNFIELIKL
jgi:mRNA interferase MazF